MCHENGGRDYMEEGRGLARGSRTTEVGGDK